jgi:hypothetical protein
MVSSVVGLKHQERFTELCELACREPDQDKVGDLFEEILWLLESQTTQPGHSTHAGKAHRTAASVLI